jgi:hypothetical protein
MNYREAWSEGEIEAGTLLDEIDRLRAEVEALRATNAAFAKRQDWWNERMFEMEQKLEALRADAGRFQWLLDHPHWDVTYRIKPGKPKEFRMREEGMDWGQWWPTERQAIDAARAAQAVAQERERCAGIADGASRLPNVGDHFDNGWCSAALQIAQAIRAGSPSPQPPAIPAGWRLVPEEAMPEMTRAAVIYANGNAVYKNVSAEVLKIEESIYAEVYAAMTAAAPQPPSASPEQIAATADFRCIDGKQACTGCLMRGECVYTPPPSAGEEKAADSGRNGE